MTLNLPNAGWDLDRNGGYVRPGRDQPEGRVYVVEALCDFAPHRSRSWLLRRWTTAAILAGQLTGLRNVGFSEAERQGLADAYASVLNRADWTAVALAHMKEGDDRSEWIRHATRGIRLNAFTPTPEDK